MALSKSIAQPTGVTLTYWRVTSVKTCLASGLTECTVSGYPDKAARDAGYAPQRKLRYTWNGVVGRDHLVVGGDALAACYTKLKQATPAFAPVNLLAGATDI